LIAHPQLTAQQVKLLNLLKYIAENGAIVIDKLYEPPFTLILHNGIDDVGIDDVFSTHDIDALIQVLKPFAKKEGGQTPAQQ
tara:strand:- start:1454 stop:1699 length:246 start_codon:yes stop_codon:yes gene_type:complete